MASSGSVSRFVLILEPVGYGNALERCAVVARRLGYAKRLLAGDFHQRHATALISLGQVRSRGRKVRSRRDATTIPDSIHN